MKSRSGIVAVDELAVELIRKNIRHLYIRVNRDDGRVRVSAPEYMDEATIRAAVAGRLEWIRRQQQRVGRDSPAARRMVSGETHYLLGEPLRLSVVEQPGRPGMRIVDDATMELRVRPGASTAKRLAVLEQGYRRELGERIPALVRKWEPVMGVQVAEWRIKRMKTRWGSCNIRDRRIWLNLELARRPPESLEYVTVHEMVHLLERRHNARFHAFMDRFLPDWRDRRRQLREMPDMHRR
jgi:predicted metal-dependent hydrolase